MLLTTLDLNIGETRAKFNGAINASSSGAATFVLSNNLPFNGNLYPADEVTTSIQNPLGMTGVTLEDLAITASFSEKEEVDLSLTASAIVSSLTLDGAIVFEESQPRLVLVQLIPATPLTLAGFVTDVVGQSWQWADGVANEFAFQSGDMYYLSPPSGSKGNRSYTYPYTPTGGGQPITCKPGYHIDAQLQIFGKDFQISLAVESNGISLTTTEETPIDFDFVTFKNPSLTITTIPPASFQISTSLQILSTSIEATVTAGYGGGSFSGEVTADLGNITIPGGSAQDVNLDIGFKWSHSSGFQITKIGGLPTNTLDTTKQFSDLLNKMGTGGCQQIADNLFKNAIKTTFKPKLNGSPSKSSSGQMTVPLALTYELELGTNPIPGTGAAIDFEAVFDIPTSLHDLPAAIWNSIIDSVGTILEDVLSDGATYQALAVEAVKQGAFKLGARMLCRAREEAESGDEEFTDEYVENLGNELGEAAQVCADAATLEETVELDAAIMAASLLGVSVAVGGLLGLLQTIWNWLTGSDDKKKEEAEQQITNLMTQTQQKLQPLLDKISAIKTKIEIQKLTVCINTAGAFQASWGVADFNSNELGSGTAVQYTLTMLGGEPGDNKAQTWGGTTPLVIQNTNQSVYTQAWENIPDHDAYRMNASIYSSITGITFLTTEMENSFNSTISKLNSADNSVATNFATYLQNQMALLKRYNKGLDSDPVYAVMSPSGMTVGQSLIGLNSRISSN